MTTSRRLTAACLTALALTLGTAGAAGAEPIWVLPGVDLGPVLGPTVGVPGALAPIFDTIRLIGG